jgi:hypothetical protein
MIIKVPVYVELSKAIDQEALPELVTKLGVVFTNILRKEDIAKITQTKRVTGLGKVSNDYDLKIISRDKALDALRTSK